LWSWNLPTGPFLISEPAEWARLDAMCRIPISRFYRDRGTFDLIAQQLLPEVAATASARGDDAVKCWSAGCASGEEPYTLAMAGGLTFSATGRRSALP
jgi:chemotaxis protein methyltransferase CheR